MEFCTAVFVCAPIQDAGLDNFQHLMFVQASIREVFRPLLSIR